MGTLGSIGRGSRRRAKVGCIEGESTTERREREHTNAGVYTPGTACTGGGVSSPRYTSPD